VINPALLGHTLFPARDIIAAAQENSLELPTGDSAIEFDVDTWEELHLIKGVRPA
jgi:hypothetical protein